MDCNRWNRITSYNVCYTKLLRLNFEHLENGGIRFESPAHCDLFHSADGNYVVNKSPRLLFKPDADFSLSAKITVDFHERWDAGDLIVYNDELHWAKFCFEADFNHQPRVVSVVCNGIADDCNSMPIEGNVMYYRITSYNVCYTKLLRPSVSTSNSNTQFALVLS